MQGLRGPRRLRPGLAGMPIGAGASQKGERIGPANGPAGSLPAPGSILGFLAFDAPTGRDGNHPEIPKRTSPSFGLYWPVATGPGGGGISPKVFSQAGAGRAPPRARSSPFPTGKSPISPLSAGFLWARRSSKIASNPISQARTESTGENPMPRGICSVVVVILLSAPAAVAQLPPEILVDQYLLEADQRMAQKDAAGAYEAIQRILALQEEHDLTLPEEFHFKSAQVAFAAGSFSSALESVNQYLVAAGRDGAFYQKALELLLATQAAAERIPCAGQPKGAECWMELANHAGCYLWEPDFHPYKIATWTAECSGGLAQGTGTVRWVWDLDRKPQEESPPSEKAAPSPNESGPDRGPKVRTGSPSSFQNEPTCAGQPKGTACWMELSNQPGCYVWNGSLAVDATVIWTGECAEGMGEGTGTLNWVWDGGKESSETTGRLQAGKRHGQWVLRDSDGGVGEGPYVEGERHGQWMDRLASGEVQEGPYQRGKRHGVWVWRGPTGGVFEGPYVEGERHGQWVERYANGTVSEGPCVEGVRHGQWVLRYANGTVEDLFYLDGERVRGTGEGAYVDGKMHGQWVIREKDGGRPGRLVCQGQEARQLGHSILVRDRLGRPVCGGGKARAVGYTILE